MSVPMVALDGTRHVPQRTDAGAPGSGLAGRRGAEQTTRYDTIDAIVQSEAEKRPDRVSYLTCFHVAGSDGG